MGYLGNRPAESYASFERQVFTIVNSQTAYTLDHSVVNENDIRLVVNNVVQEPGSGKSYTASGTSLTLSAALVNGTDTMYAVFLGRALQTVNPPNASVGTAQLAATSVTAAKLNNDIISGTTALASEPADTDEFLVSDAGTIKRIDYSLIKGISSITPFFGATQSGTVTGISDGVIAKLTCDTEVFDSNGAYDPSTNYRFTIPTGEGGTYLFFFAAKIRSDTLHQLRAADILLRKNGSTICSNNSNYNQNLALQYHAATFWMDTGSASDYYEIFFQPSVDSGTGKGNNARFFGYKID